MTTRTKPSTNGHANGHARNRIAAVLAVGYVRMSSDKQDKSPKQQRDEIERHAKERGYQILRWYVDEGISGWKHARPGFQRLVKDAEAGEFQLVLCWDQDRFSRFDPLDFFHYCRTLRNAGVEIETIAQGRLDFESISGLVTSAVNQHGEAQFVRDLARNVCRGMSQQAKVGAYMNNVRYGYDREYRDAAGKVVLLVPHGKKFTAPADWTVRPVVSQDKEAVETIRFIFQTFYSTDTNTKAIARELNRLGYKAPRGRQWGWTSVQSVLRCAFYAGQYEFGINANGQMYRATADGPAKAEGPRAMRPPIISIADHHEALVDRASLTPCKRSWTAARSPVAAFAATATD